MQKRFEKYFWDGKPDDFSATYRVKRIIEYASFPDLIQYNFEELKSQLLLIDLHKLRTSPIRREFIIKVQPYLNASQNWEQALRLMIQPFFDYTDKDYTDKMTGTSES
jgi:hypothetical protein